MRHFALPIAALLAFSVQSAIADTPGYVATNLVTDNPAINPAPLTDPHLINAWGIVFNGGSPFWVSSNGLGLSNLYGGAVTTPLTKNAMEVTIPGGNPTGMATNSSTTDFIVTSGASSGNARFLWATENGIVAGWNPGVPPPPNSTQAQIGFSDSTAVYKGLALATGATINGVTGSFLYASDFHNDKIEVLNNAFAPVTMPSGAFTDPSVPAGFAPFNIQLLAGKLYVTYAKQDAAGRQDVAGAGNGYLAVFDTAGNLISHLASNGALNSPWGLAIAPNNFGSFSSDLLVGNFGNGRINAFNPTSGAFLGTLFDNNNADVVIPGLWGLDFGSGTGAGPKNVLFFAAGPQNETHGVFGQIAIPEPTALALLLPAPLLMTLRKRRTQQ